jgi:hypothetical protein
MSIDYQSLREGSEWWHARVWFRRADWFRRGFGSVEVGWRIPSRGLCSWGIEFGGEDRGITLSFSVPWLLYAWVSFRNVFSRDPFKWTFEQGNAREISISIHDGGLWWHLWVGPMASWSRTSPWCKWWRQGVVRPFGDWRHVRHEWLRPDGAVYRAPGAHGVRRPSRDCGDALLRLHASRRDGAETHGDGQRRGEGVALALVALDAALPAQDSPNDQRAVQRGSRRGNRLMEGRHGRLRLRLAPRRDDARRAAAHGKRTNLLTADHWIRE